MSSFLASFFQSSLSGTNSANNSASKSKSAPSTTETAVATTATATASATAVPVEDVSNCMDAIPPHERDESSSGAEPAIRQSHSIPPPPSRYFATRLLPPHVSNSARSGAGNGDDSTNPTTHPNSKSRWLNQRSMSKLFTTLPTATASNQNKNEVIEPIPNFPQMMIDMMEYIMYVILLETNVSKAIQEHYHQLMTMIQVFRSHRDGTANPTHQVLLQSPSPNHHHPHRFSNRMMMTAFTCDILQLCPSFQQQQQEWKQENKEANITHTATTSAIELPPEGWRELKKRLQALKLHLLSIHANDNPAEVVANAALTTTITTTAESEDTRTRTDNNHHGTTGSTLDEQLSNHVMMTTDFDTVVTLLSVQEILASFREQLEDIKEDIEENEVQQGKDYNRPDNHMNKLVETCVSSFMKNLTDLFPPSPPLNLPKNDEEDDDYLIGVESERTKTMSNTGTLNHYGNDNIPHELLSLALIELYSPKQSIPKLQHPNPHHPLTEKNKTNIVDRLLYDIQCLIVDNGSVGGTIGAGGRFSYANLVDKVRSLLLKWSQSILDVPTLVRLGYGGVPSPIVEKDEDDVSSWGSHNDNNNNTNMMRGSDVFTSTIISVDARQHHQRPRKSRTSFATAPNAEPMMRHQPQHRSYSITAEEQDIIARLAATTTAATGMPKQNDSDVPSIEVADVEETYIAKSKDIDVGADDTIAASQNNVETEIGTAELYSDLHGKQKNVSNGTPVVRKVVKASRRFLTSFNFASRSHNDNNVSAFKRDTGMAKNDSNDSMANQRLMHSINNSVINSTNKKRTASDYLDENMSITFDDATRPEKIRRRNNIWAMNQRNKMRMKYRKDPNNNDSLAMIHLTPIHGKGDNSSNENSLIQTTPPRMKTLMPGKSPTSSMKKQQRRTFFTDVEVQALMEGIQKFGVGKWSMIQKSDLRLQGRTPIQLKDKYRHIVSITSLSSSSSMTPSPLLPAMTKD